MIMTETQIAERKLENLVERAMKSKQFGVWCEETYHYIREGYAFCMSDQVREIRELAQQTNEPELVKRTITKYVPQKSMFVKEEQSKIIDDAVKAEMERMGYQLDGESKVYLIKGKTLLTDYFDRHDVRFKIENMARTEAYVNARGKFELKEKLWTIAHPKSQLN